MTAAGRAQRLHRQSQYALAVALAALGFACLVAATQLAVPANAQPVGAHVALSAETPTIGSRPAATASPRPAAPSASAQAAASPPERPSSAPLPASIEIPAIDLHSDLVVLGLDDEDRLEVPGDPDLAGWYAGGPRPGEGGAAVVVGHVDWTDGPAVFWRLPELTPGDRVVVHGRDGTATAFVVDRLERWAKAEFPTDLVYRDGDGPELRLVTCGGPFDVDERSYRDNIIVFATLAPPA